MITPEEITKKARRKYRDVLRAYLRHEIIFPIKFPVGKPTKDLAVRRKQIQVLRDQARSEGVLGYDVVWETTKQRDLGEQTVPKQILIASIEDYLTILCKKTEFNNFVTDVAKIRAKFPQLDDWLQQYPHRVIEHHGRWDDLLAVCDYFVKQPRPNVYIRELPIEVHTKFIERHKTILRTLLDALLPQETITHEASDFVHRFGLRDKPPLVRIRLLDEQLDWQYTLKVDDLALPVDQLAHLLEQHVQPRHVIIVENLINFLTLPPYPETVALFGGGFAVHMLRGIKWLNRCNLVYWGDIDAYGFQILSDFRGIFPHTRSALMDRETLDHHELFIVPDNQVKSERFAYLHDAEREVMRYVLQHHIRLEQEHIPHTYAVDRLKQILKSK